MNIRMCNDLQAEADKLTALLVESGFEAKAKIFSEGVRDILATIENECKSTDQKGMMVKIHGSSRFVLYRDISYAEVIAHTVHIRLVDGNEIRVYSSFADFAPQLLCDNRFLQCHRSYIVNVNNIERIAEKQVVMRSGEAVPISRGYLPVKKEMAKRMI